MTDKRNSMAPQVHIIGASGRSGFALCRSLLADGVAFVPVVRDAAKWAATGIGVTARIADLADRRAPARCAGRRHADRQLCPRAARTRRAGRRAAGGAVRLPGQHAQVHALARRARQRRTGGRGGLPRLRPFRRHAAPHDDLRRPGRGQRAASRRPAAPAADRSVARWRRGAGAADPPGRRDARNSRRTGIANGTGRMHW